ncbi:Uncharacterized phage-associated protein [Granulicatella balaenopterae]|uniref:Uncharacterized phage-associated protein n=1 Tax=Granulicatella balaenopterae TaxID=137733 RepID=A0A1H9IJJ5_9LACT|nr:type II toxin-antitoxin system antitoxin SocA domain-containing protein [Granulicatella balaenopterae]SEQ74662.1 Uncharacterized phage-associated protein [Granulicatella balaenopterae]
MKSYSYKIVAQWFLSQEAMTPKKLQKLMYYFEAWGQALFSEKMIADTEFEAWVHGPVSPELYREYKGFGWRDIPQGKNNDEVFSDKVLDLLYSIWATYGDKSANELEALTHIEAPWRNARQGYAETDNCNVKIKAEDMKEYYSSIYIGD